MVVPEPITTEPPSAVTSALCTADPEAMLIRPVAPVESPVCSRIFPVSPELDVPEENDNTPLAPFTPALLE